MDGHCSICRHYSDLRNKCKFNSNCDTEKCDLYIVKEYVNSNYVNVFDIACSQCGTITAMAIKGNHNYCYKCGNKL